MKQAIIEGFFVSSCKVEKKQILIDLISLKILAIGQHLGEPHFCFTKDQFIFSGFIDIHTHAREDVSGKENYKEDYTTLSSAAHHGGVIGIMDMPNNPIIPSDDESFRRKLELMNRRVSLLAFPYAAILPGSTPLNRHVPYKLFLGPSVGGPFFCAEKQLHDTLKSYRGQHISFHCEDPEVLTQHRDQPLHHLRRPREAEIVAIEKVIELTELYELKTIICHISTKEGLLLSLKAKERGVNLQIEVSPHHLYFDIDDKSIAENPYFHVNPPLRSKEDRVFLLEILKKGEIDFLATDHAPHTLEEKHRGVSGLPHLDTYGHFVSWLIEKENISETTIAKMCCENPGRFLGQFLNLKLGKIDLGYHALFTILDKTKTETITTNILRTKNRHSPFENTMFTAFPYILDFKKGAE